MNDLGALYYMGDLVEQDYAKAAELYEMAADAGCFQSIINLGYIYEYGRTGKPDHTKAYQWYSLAAALAPSSEAVYKLGACSAAVAPCHKTSQKHTVCTNAVLSLSATMLSLSSPPFA